MTGKDVEQVSWVDVGFSIGEQALGIAFPNQSLSSLLSFVKVAVHVGTLGSGSQ